MTHHEFTIPTLSRIPSGPDDIQEDTQRVCLMFWRFPPGVRIYAEAFDPVSEVYFRVSTREELREILLAVGLPAEHWGIGIDAFGRFCECPANLQEGAVEPILSFLNSPKFHDEMKETNELV